MRSGDWIVIVGRVAGGSAGCLPFLCACSFFVAAVGPGRIVSGIFELLGDLWANIWNAVGGCVPPLIFLIVAAVALSFVAKALRPVPKE